VGCVHTCMCSQLEITLNKKHSYMAAAGLWTEYISQCDMSMSIVVHLLTLHKTGNNESETWSGKDGLMPLQGCNDYQGRFPTSVL
jgi:hypothetical protein